MGGVPRCFLLSLALPTSHTEDWLNEFLDGLRRASRRFQCVLAGGDTTHRNEILINVTVIGESQTGSAGLRSGARPGDLVYVSGRLGEAGLGLQLLKRSRHGASSKDPYMQKHLYPEPRLALGRWLVKRQLATAMMDLSDGLSSDLSRLCAASGVGARLEAAEIPVTQTMNSNTKDPAVALRLALHGGDDYELLFTAPRKRANSLPRSFKGLPLTQIGIVTSNKKIVLVNKNGREQRLDPGGWDPFRAHRLTGGYS
jgi:thiamine-monophosphate kinase